VVRSVELKVPDDDEEIDKAKLKFALTEMFNFYAKKYSEKPADFD
jgi:hypothetical protein